MPSSIRRSSIRPIRVSLRYRVANPGRLPRLELSFEVRPDHLQSRTTGRRSRVERRVGSRVSRNSLRGLDPTGLPSAGFPGSDEQTEDWHCQRGRPCKSLSLAPKGDSNPPLDNLLAYVYSVRTVPMGQRRRSGPPPIVRTAERVAGPVAGPAGRRAVERNCARCGASCRKSLRRVADRFRWFVGTEFVFSPRSHRVRYAEYRHGRRHSAGPWAIDAHAGING